MGSQGEKTEGRQPGRVFSAKYYYPCDIKKTDIESAKSNEVVTLSQELLMCCVHIKKYNGECEEFLKRWTIKQFLEKITFGACVIMRSCGLN